MRSADGTFYLPGVPFPKPAPTEQRRVRDSHGHFETGKSRLVRDLSGPWTRFGLS